MKVDVGGVTDFAEGTMRVVEVNGREVGVALWGGRPYAVRNVCPHMGGAVCRGSLRGKLVKGTAGAGSVALDGETPLVVCAWHRWEFDLRTGRAIFDDRWHLRTYPAEVEAGRVLVEMGGSPARSSAKAEEEEVAHG